MKRFAAFVLAISAMSALGGCSAFLNALTELGSQVYKVRATVADAATTQPLLSAEVFVDGTQYSELTNAAGDFEMELPEGSWLLRFEKGGYDDLTVAVDVDANTPRVELGVVSLHATVPPGAVGAWQFTTSFVTPRVGQTAEAIDGFVYVVGGLNAGTALTSVEYAPLLSDGAVGQWSATNSLNDRRFSHGTFHHGGYLYVVGGGNGSGKIASVEFAQIQADGSLGAWTRTTPLPFAARMNGPVVLADRVYVLGGVSTNYIADVMYAAINEDGTLSPWTATTSLSIARALYPRSIAYRGRIYAIGGFNWNLSPRVRDDVTVAVPNADGSITAWIETSPLATAVACSDFALHNGIIYAAGGTTTSGPGGRVNDVQYAHIDPQGNVSAWALTTPFTIERDCHSLVTHGGYLYVLGGRQDEGASARNDVQFARIGP